MEPPQHYTADDITVLKAPFSVEQLHRWFFGDIQLVDRDVTDDGAGNLTAWIQQMMLSHITWYEPDETRIHPRKGGWEIHSTAQWFLSREDLETCTKRGVVGAIEQVNAMSPETLLFLHFRKVSFLLDGTDYFSAGAALTPTHSPLKTCLIFEDVQNYTRQDENR